VTRRCVLRQQRRLSTSSQSLPDGGTHSDEDREQRPAADAFQRPLRSRFQARLSGRVGVCRDKPARCEGVHVSDRAGRAHHTGPESGARVGHGARAAWTGGGAGRVSSPGIGLLLGADALRTRGRPHGGRRQGEAAADLAGSKTSGRHGTVVCGTREALHLAWASAPRSARRTAEGARA
jgi:hypothetical protein